MKAYYRIKTKEIKRDMRRARKALSILLLMALVVSTYTVPAFAEDTSAVMEVTGTYGQDDARAMLEVVNSFRQEADVWQWNEDNTTKTVFNQNGAKDIGVLKYDYDLEQIAMQRAMEVAISFSHTRPDGTSCFSATYNGTRSWGENIAAGSANYQDTFKQWREEDDDYKGQGHRRNMLAQRYTAIGIGHVVYKGTHYWVQEFGDKCSDAAQTAANNGETTVETQVVSSQLSRTPVLSATPESYQVNSGETVNLPSIEIQFQLNGTWPGTRTNTAKVAVGWTAASDIISVADKTFTGNKSGKTQLKAEVFGQTLAVDVEVISTCDHEWDAGVVTKQPTCTAAGIRTYTCGICKETREEEIAALPHDLLVTPAVEATCTSAGSTEGKVCKVCNTVVAEVKTVPALGHDLSGWEVITEATWDTEGKEERSCSRCDFKESRPIASLSSGHEHSFTGTETVLKEASCTESGEKQIACISAPDCDAVQTSTIPALGHDWSEWKVEIEATWDTEGKQVHSCSRCRVEESEVIKKLSETHEHAFNGTETILKEATCTEDGEKQIACFEPRCQEVKKEAIPALGHKYGNPVFEWSGDYKSAGAVFTCSACNDVQRPAVEVAAKTNGNMVIYTASVAFDGKNYTDTKMVTLLPDKTEDGREVRFVSEPGIKNIPEELKKIEVNGTKLDTEDAITQVMADGILEHSKYENKDNVQIYDVELQAYNADSKVWEKVDAENFPKNGLEVTIPYPAGTSKEKYDFSAAHMFTHDMNGHKAGEIEYPAVTKADEGVRFTVNGLSPIMVAWQEKTAGSGDPVKKPAATDKGSQTQANTKKAPKTGDLADTGMLLLYLTVSIGMMGCVLAYRRKRV